MVKMTTREPTVAHHAFLLDLKAVIGKHQQLSAMEMLAVTAQLVGTLIALQDQQKMTPEMAMDLVAKNIEAGNQEAIANVFKTAGRA